MVRLKEDPCLYVVGNYCRAIAWTRSPYNSANKIKIDHGFANDYKSINIGRSTESEPPTATMPTLRVAMPLLATYRQAAIINE
jgi:hypothetical protein